MQDYNIVRNTMNHFVKEMNFSKDEIREMEIISGHCYKGADALGEEFAKKNHLKLTLFPAKWDLYGNSAGPFRNAEMAEYASKSHGFLIAFWDGKSKGTKSMIREAKKSGLSIRIYNVFTGEEYNKGEKHG